MKYRNRLALYEETEGKNEIGETTHEFGKIKDIYCSIAPKHGGVRNIGGTEAEEAHTMQRIFVRKLSIEKPSITMYFLDDSGNEYEVLDYFPNYKDNSEWEFRTRINYV